MNGELQLIGSSKAEDTYEKLSELIKHIDYQSPSNKDKEWLKLVLEILFMTEPINNNKPFDVEWKIKDDSIKGQKFSIQSYQLQPRSSFNGLSYDIKILAVTEDMNYYYEMEGVARPNKPNLSVKRAIIGDLS